VVERGGFFPPVPEFTAFEPKNGGVPFSPSPFLPLSPGDKVFLQGDIVFLQLSP